MSSRQKEKERRRQQRLEAEQAPRGAAARRRPEVQSLLALTVAACYALFGTMLLS